MGGLQPGLTVFAPGVELTTNQSSQPASQTAPTPPLDGPQHLIIIIILCAAAGHIRRYPHIIAGAVAASAPVGQFPSADFKPSDFWEVCVCGVDVWS